MQSVAKKVLEKKIGGISITPMIVAGLIAFTCSAFAGSMLMEPSAKELEAKEVVNTQYSSFLNKQQK